MFANGGFGQKIGTLGAGAQPVEEFTIRENGAITVTNNATGVGFATQSTSSGDFTVPNLPVGTYSMRVVRDGFKAAIRNDIVVTAGGTVTANVLMELGAVTETIQVAASLELLQTSTAKVSSAVANKMVDELPLVVGGAIYWAMASSS